MGTLLTPDLRISGAGSRQSRSPPSREAAKFSSSTEFSTPPCTQYCQSRWQSARDRVQ